MTTDRNATIADAIGTITVGDVSDVMQTIVTIVFVLVVIAFFGVIISRNILRRTKLKKK